MAVREAVNCGWIMICLASSIKMRHLTNCLSLGWRLRRFVFAITGLSAWFMPKPADWNAKIPLKNFVEEMCCMRFWRDEDFAILWLIHHLTDRLTNQPTKQQTNHPTSQVNNSIKPSSLQDDVRSKVRFSISYWTQSFFIVCKTARHFSIFWAKLIESVPSHHASVISTLIRGLEF